MPYQLFMPFIGAFVGAFWGCYTWRLIVGKLGASGAPPPQDFAAQIRKLEVKDGDIVVVRLHVGASGKAMPTICRELKRVIAHTGINAMGVVLDGGASLDVLTASSDARTEVPDRPNRETGDSQKDGE